MDFGSGSVPLLGVLLAIAAATAFALQYIFVRVGTTDGSVSDVMLVSLLCNVVVTVPLAAVLYYPDYDVTLRSLASFAAAGVVGSLFARVLEYRSVEEIGASRTSPIVSSNALFATLLAVVFLDETLSALHVAGIVLIVTGVTALSWETAAGSGTDRSFREAGAALAIPLSAAFFVALEPIVVSVGYLEGTAVLPGFAIKAVAGLIGFLGYRWWTRGAPIGDGFVRSSLKWYVGVGLANTVGIGLYFGALAVAPVAVVMPLLQTAPLIVVVLSAAFLPRHLERITWRLVSAAGVVVTGTALVSVS
jgi:drug/metabolite transporter (DMT)-like permease